MSNKNSRIFLGKLKTSSKIAKSQSLVGHSKTAKPAMVPQIDSLCVNKKYSMKHIDPTPIVNRFWPLIDDSEPKVVIGEFNDSVISQRQKCNKKMYNATSRSHTDTVGGDLGHTNTDCTVLNGVALRCSSVVANMQDKYDLALTFKAKHKEKLDKAKVSKIFKDWDTQTVGKFGFIPVSQQILPVDQKPDRDMLEVHKKVKNKGTYNFLGAQICVPSQLRHEAWENNLEKYWDKQLIHLIRYGFPLSFDDKITLSSATTNHSSAVKFPNDIKTYIQEEKRFDAILGPFEEPPISNLHISPFLTREKAVYLVSLPL